MRRSKTDAVAGRRALVALGGNGGTNGEFEKTQSKSPCRDAAAFILSVCTSSADGRTVEPHCVWSRSTTVSERKSCRKAIGVEVT